VNPALRQRHGTVIGYSHGGCYRVNWDGTSKHSIDVLIRSNLEKIEHE